MQCVRSVGGSRAAEVQAGLYQQYSSGRSFCTTVVLCSNYSIFELKEKLSRQNVQHVMLLHLPVYKSSVVFIRRQRTAQVDSS